MNTEVTMTILERLIDGVHPMTGEVLPVDHICREPDVIRAFRHALTCVAREEDAPEEARYIKRNGQLNAGRPWTKEDDAELIALMQQGLTPEQIAPRIQRRARGVYNRLAAMEAGRPVKRIAPRNAGAPWTPADDVWLAQLYRSGASVAEMAGNFGRTHGSIRSRLKKLFPDEMD